MTMRTTSTANHPDNYTPALEKATISVEAEQQVLGAILTNNSLYGEISGDLKTEHFGDPVHAKLYEICASKIDAGALASPVTISKDAQALTALDELGGPSYLVRLAGAAIHTSAIREYAAMVIDLWAKRSLIESTREAEAQILGEATPGAEIALTLESKLGVLSSKASANPLITTRASALYDAIEKANAAYMGDETPGMTSGLTRLDDATGGFHPGDLVVLGGRPSMGKTTLAQGIAAANIKKGVGVYYGSLEMLAPAMEQRFLSMGLADQGIRVPYRKIRSGDMTETEFRHVVEEAKRQDNSPLIYGDRSVKDGLRLRASINRAKQRFEDDEVELGLVVVDYLQLIDFENAWSQNDRVSRASELCKNVAMDLKIPVIALSQLSRTVEHRDPPVPQLSDLRDSGSLEQDADVVAFCYREAYYLERKLDATPSAQIEERADLEAQLHSRRDQMDVLLPKQRSNAVGKVTIYNDLACCQVSSDRRHTDGELI